MIHASTAAARGHHPFRPSSSTINQAAADGKTTRALPISTCGCHCPLNDPSRTVPTIRSAVNPNCLLLAKIWSWPPHSHVVRKHRPARSSVGNHCCFRECAATSRFQDDQLQFAHLLARLSGTASTSTVIWSVSNSRISWSPQFNPPPT